MKSFKVECNSYLNTNVNGYYNAKYIGFRKEGNPDYINYLKNMTKAKNELQLVEPFMQAYEVAKNDIEKIITKEGLRKVTICVMPRSKTDKSYHRSQLLFKKAIASASVNMDKCTDGTDAVIRVKNTKTTHNFWAENNSGDSPYKGITRDTCEIAKDKIDGKSILLVDDVYTKGVNIIEDCIQTLFDYGAKSIVLYTLAKVED